MNELEILAEPLTTKVEDRVRRGAMLLDERTPRWEAKIELEILNMACIDYCILGQLYGGYCDGLDYLGLCWYPDSDPDSDIMDDDAWYGFDQCDADGYIDLDHLWVEEIAKRLEEEDG